MDHLERYKDYAPAVGDVPGLRRYDMGFSDVDDGDRSEWFVCPVILTRDSEPLEESNFRTMERLLEDVDPDGECWENHRFGHWAVGWIEILIVRPDSKAWTQADSAAQALADYPVLDDEDYSERELDDSQEAWEHCYSMRDKIGLCAEVGISIFAARSESVPIECHDRIRER